MAIFGLLGALLMRSTLFSQVRQNKLIAGGKKRKTGDSIIGKLFCSPAGACGVPRTLVVRRTFIQFSEGGLRRAPKQRKKYSYAQFGGKKAHSSKQNPIF